MCINRHFRIEKGTGAEIRPAIGSGNVNGEVTVNYWPIAQVRYIKILTRLRGFMDKIANISRLHCLAIPRRDLSTKKTKPNIEI